ncbi:MAG: response regulator [Cytophagaceae bacterium]|jgi:DNA-binding NtrC family response regulator|nr:response regulator [Cytophagaceae bacterium]
MSYNIILLDSDAKHANLIKEHLKGYSEYSIHVFTDAASCIAQLKHLKPAVIFLDAELKHDPAAMEAEKELLFHLKELSPNAEIVLYSGEEKIELMLDKVKQGAHGFALKTTHTHAKAEMLLLSAIRHYKQRKESRFYKALTIVLIIALLIGFVFSIIVYKYNLISNGAASLDV